MNQSIYFALFSASCLGMGFMVGRVTAPKAAPAVVEVLKEVQVESDQAKEAREDAAAQNEQKDKAKELAALCSELKQDYSEILSRGDYLEMPSALRRGPGMIREARRLDVWMNDVEYDHPLRGAVSSLRTEIEGCGEYVQSPSHGIKDVYVGDRFRKIVSLSEDLFEMAVNY